MPAFRRKWRHTTKHSAMKYLPDDSEYKVMHICTVAAGDVVKGSMWYESKPLSDVYRWLAVRLAEVDDTD